ncbi:MAG: HAD-IC family P-type ATPase [Anaerolineae bacterium]|nr:HAD-IC family P-type ATPase [Anaerolineae bacterium]
MTIPATNTQPRDAAPAPHVHTPPGLTSAEVAERVARGEVNQYKIQVGRTYWEIVRDNIFNVFNVVLAILGAVMIIFRDYTNLLFASFSVVLNSTVGLIQEIAAKRALERLAAMSIQQVKVWRDGKLVTLPIDAIVKDDVIPVEPGDRIAVDGEVLSADALEMDEALLTGESDAVLKEVGDTLCSGSFVVAGSGVMRATHVGAESTVNKLSATAKAYRHPLTPTQKQINGLVQIAVVVMLLFGPMTVIAGYATRLPTIEVVRNAVVLVTSMVPQGLVLVTTISLSIGALIISRNRTLVQRINAVESMANVTTLCFDKTGTLTQNMLAVTRVIPLNGADEDAIKGDLRLYVGSLSHQNKTAAAVAGYVGQGQSGAPKVNEIPFNSARKWGAVAFAEQTLVMGAPERVLDAAHSGDAVRTAADLAAQGQRVLAFCRVPGALGDGSLPAERQPIALIVMSDNVRPEIGQTIDAFRKLNVALKVISGDNLETVTSIASSAGMEISGGVTGDQLERMDHDDFRNAVADSSVFARIEPQTKRKIIAELRAQGQYVAMVGDGVNDVPALKEANLAVAMNDGAQIAKDVADLVLLDNSMATLPLAFEKGKTITQKIFGTVRLFLVKNFYTVLAFIFIGFMALPFSTTPILISWLTFGIVNIPGGLITFGVIRPAYMRDYAHDVLRYVLAAVIVGGLIMAGLYALLFLAQYDVFYHAALTEIAPGVVTPDMVATAQADARAYEPARDVARSALFVFMALYGTLVFWNTMGIDVFQPKTFAARPGMAVLGAVTLLITILPPYFLPDLFLGWVAPTLVLWLLTFFAAALGAVALKLLLEDGRLMGMLLRRAPVGQGG